VSELVKFKILFEDEIEAETEPEAYDKLLAYLSECVSVGDVTAFEFIPPGDEENK